MQKTCPLPSPTNPANPHPQPEAGEAFEYIPKQACKNTLSLHLHTNTRHFNRRTLPPHWLTAPEILRIPGTGSGTRLYKKRGARKNDDAMFYRCRVIAHVTVPCAAHGGAVTGPSIRAWGRGQCYIRSPSLKHSCGKRRWQRDATKHLRGEEGGRAVER